MCNWLPCIAMPHLDIDTARRVVFLKSIASYYSVHKLWSVAATSTKISELILTNKIFSYLPTNWCKPSCLLLASHSHTHAYLTFKSLACCSRVACKSLVSCLRFARKLLASSLRVARKSLAWNSPALVTLWLGCTVYAQISNLCTSIHICTGTHTFENW